MANKGKKPVGLPRHSWNSLKAMNRIPEVELERKIADINRYRAYNIRERHLEERALWDEMFHNEKVLKTSLARFPRQEVVNRLILVEKDGTEDQPLPFAEHYRQFIVFKARRMAKIFGTKIKRPPRYSELYRKELAPAKNNKRNVKSLLKKYHDAMIADQKKLDVLNEDQRPPQEDPGDSLAHFPFEANEATVQFTGRKLSLKTQHARRHHRRDSKATQGQGDSGSAKHSRENNGESDSENKSEMTEQNPAERTIHDGESDLHQGTQLANKEDDLKKSGESQSTEDAYSKGEVKVGFQNAAFYLPKISDRFKSKSDRKIHRGVDSTEEGHVSPLPEVRRKTPELDIYKRRRRRRRKSSQSSSDEDED